MVGYSMSANVWWKCWADLFVINRCYDSSKTPSLCDWRFGDGGQGVEVLEGVDGIFGGQGGFEVSGFGGVADWGLRFGASKACEMIYFWHTNLHSIFLSSKLI